MKITKDELKNCHQSAKKTASLGNLNLFKKVRSSYLGSVISNNTGNSIEFHDQRSYYIGDDPRYINWNAYARTDQLIMKIFKDERAPMLDLVLDLSNSMFYDQEKRLKFFELIYVTLEESLKFNASVRIYAISSNGLELINHKQLLSYKLDIRLGSGINLNILNEVPLRYGSTRILISDLLDFIDPSIVLKKLVNYSGSVHIWAPFTPLENDLSGVSGIVEFLDAESNNKIKVNIGDDQLKLYSERYSNYMKLWNDLSIKYKINLKRFNTSNELMRSFY